MTSDNGLAFLSFLVLETFHLLSKGSTSSFLGLGRDNTAAASLIRLKSTLLQVAMDSSASLR